jgi:hypothetical protein
LFRRSSCVRLVFCRRRFAIGPTHSIAPITCSQTCTLFATSLSLPAPACGAVALGVWSLKAGEIGPAGRQVKRGPCARHPR